MEKVPAKNGCWQKYKTHKKKEPASKSERQLRGTEQQTAAAAAKMARAGADAIAGGEWLWAGGG